MSNVYDIHCRYHKLKSQLVKPITQNFTKITHNKTDITRYILSSMSRKKRKKNFSTNMDITAQ